jgi:hypothetical protein
MRLAAIMAAAFLTAAPASAQEAEDMDSLPAAEARETVFYACTACHGTRIIRQQGLTRERWERTIDYMIERHSMPAPEPDDRKLIVDYLAEHFPPKQKKYQNPFLKK